MRQKAPGETAIASLSSELQADDRHVGKDQCELARIIAKALDNPVDNQSRSLRVSGMEDY